MNYSQTAKDLILELKRADWLPPYNEEGVRESLSEISLHFDELNDQVSALRAVAALQQNKDKDDDGNKTNSNNNNNASSSTTTTTSQGKENNMKLPMQSRPAILLHEASIRRTKRCLLAYHAHRLDKLKAYRWDTSTSILSTPVKSLLSEAEVDFYMEYDKLLCQFQSALGSTCMDDSEDDEMGIDGIGGGGGSGGGALGVLDLRSNLQPPEDDLIEVRVVKPGLGTILTDFFGEIVLEMGTTHFLSRGDVEHLIRQGALQQLDGEEGF